MKRLVSLVAALALLGFTASWAAPPSGNPLGGDDNPDLIPDAWSVFDSILYWCVDWSVPGLLAMPLPVPCPPPPGDQVGNPTHNCTYDSCPYWCPEWSIK